MTLILPQNRKGKIVQQCQDLPGRSPASIRELSQKLVALHTAIAVNNGFDYFLKRWGAFCQAHRTRGSQTLLESKMSDVFGLIEGSKICNLDDYSNASTSSIHTSSIRQCSCPFIFSKDGRRVYPQQSSLRYKQRDLELIAGQRNHN